jgi:hypothetical protein
MNTQQTAQLLVIIALLGWGGEVNATTVTFEEISGLVKSNLAGASPEQVDQLAVEGLLKELTPRVALVEEADDSVAAGLPSGVVDTRVYRDSIAYVRLGVIGEGTGQQLRDRYRDLVTSNVLTGLVVDLRRAGGDDYAAALQVADEFLSHEMPLLNWGEGLKRSTDKEDAITLPVAALVNGDTGGGAEALAGMLRQSGVALLIGSRTAGTAGIQRAFPVSNGQFLKITVSSIQLGDARAITATGLKPDVEVIVNKSQETAVLNGEEDPVGSATELQTNGAPARPRINEAGLVRRWRGEILSDEDLQGPTPKNGPEERDPALLRALDLMDGLAILRSWQK